MAKRAKTKAASRAGAAKKRVGAKTAVRSKATRKAAVETDQCKAAAKPATGAKRAGASAGSKRVAKKAPDAKARKRKAASAKKAIQGPRGAAWREAVLPATTQVHPQDRPLPKTRLTDKQLQEMRQLLLEKRAELAGDVRQLTREVGGQPGGGSSERSTMPIHMADIGSDNWEQEFTLGLIANERTRVQQIDEALARIEDKTYGVCLATHKRIKLARLRAKPWAKYCIEYARKRDEGRAP